MVVVCFPEYSSCASASLYGLWLCFDIVANSHVSRQVTATEVMGEIFESNGLQISGCVMTVALIIVWISIFITMLFSFKQKKLLWPKDTT